MSSPDSTQPRRVLGALPAACVAAVAASALVLASGALWRAASQSSMCSSEPWGCLLPGIAALTVGPLIGLVAVALILRVSHVARPALVAGGCLVTLFVLLRHPTGVTKALPITLLAALVAAVWAVVLHPRWPTVVPVVAGGLVAVAAMAGQLTTERALHQSTADRIRAIGVQPVEVRSPQWSYVGWAPKASGRALTLIYDTGNGERRLTVTVTAAHRVSEIPPACGEVVSPMLDNNSPDLRCARVGEQLWTIEDWAGSYLAVHDSNAVLLETIHGPALDDHEAQDLLGHLARLDASKLAGRRN